MRFSPKVAPVQVAVFPLMTRDGLDTIADEITRALHKTGIIAEYDDSGAIGRRYRGRTRSAPPSRSRSITTRRRTTRSPSGTGTA